MFFTTAARWKSIPCLWQINLGETNKHKNHCWQVLLLSQLILLRSVQQHGDFGSEATSESLFPPQNLILSCELDPALQLGNRPRLGKRKKTAFFSLIFLFFGKGSVVSQAWIQPQSSGVGTKWGSIPWCWGWGGFMGLPKPKSQLQPRPTVLVRNPLLIRRISKKISERGKKQVKTSNFCPGHLESPIGIKVGCSPGSYLG